VPFDTLQKHVNAGTIRAQRVGGKLMLHKEDVDKLKEEDGTIVLTGDSDNLSIDLGKVVDDTSETMVQPKGPKDTATGESITFGGDLEVVNFDDTNTRDLSAEEKKAGDKTGNLSFTDSNTAVMTAVDETQVGATTAPVDFQTSSNEPAQGQRRGEDSRRSVRSNRARTEVVPVSPLWYVIMVLIHIIGALLITPYYFLAEWPRGDDLARNTKDDWNHTETRRGVADSFWTGWAGGLAQFTVEPSEKKFKEINPSGTFVNMHDVDPQAIWRSDVYRGKLTGPGEKLDSFVITSVSEDGKTAYTKDKKFSYPVVEKPVNDTKVESVDLGSANQYSK